MAAKKLLLIRERDVGLFSMFWQVVNTLYLLEHYKIDRLPVVILGRGLTYFHPEGHAGRKTVWEYYFDPIVPEISEADILPALGECGFDLLESQRKALENARGAIEFPAELHMLEPLTNQDRLNLQELEGRMASLDWVATDAFLPVVDGRAFGRLTIPPASSAELVRRFIRPNGTVRAKVTEFYDRQLHGHYVIGVHMRGTDGHAAPARGVAIPFDVVFQMIEKRIAELGGRSHRILLATDEAHFVELFMARYGDGLVSYDAVRNTEDDVIGFGPTGQPMPAYITRGGKLAVRNGEDAVVEYALLCRSEVLICNGSSLADAAAISVPEVLHLAHT